MRVIRNLNGVWLNWGMSNELTSECLSPQRKHARGFDSVGTTERESCIGAMKRDPSSTLFYPRSDFLLSTLRRSNIACIRHKNLRRGNAGSVFVVRLYANSKLIVFGEQGQQFTTRKINIVVLASCYEGDVDSTSWSGVAHDVWFRSRCASRSHHQQ